MDQGDATETGVAAAGTDGADDGAGTGLPDRLSTDPASPWHDQKILERGIGIRFKGEEKTNVEEYCVSERWVRLAVGKTMRRDGTPMTIKLQGEVVPYFRGTRA